MLVINFDEVPNLQIFPEFGRELVIGLVHHVGLLEIGSVIIAMSFLDAVMILTIILEKVTISSIASLIKETRSTKTKGAIALNGARGEMISMLWTTAVARK